MKSFTPAVILAASLLLAACGADDSADEPGSAAPDVTGQTTPPPVPLPAETQPPADSPAAAIPLDTTAS